jgi:hypothetical protein
VGTPTVFLVDADAGTKKPLFDDDRLRALLKMKTGTQPEGNGTPIRDFELSDGDAQVRFRFAGKSWHLALASYALEEIQAPEVTKPNEARLIRKGYQDGEPPTLEAVSPDGSRFATEKDFNLGIRLAGSSEVESLTTDGTRSHPWVVDMARWSPDGQRLAALRIDYRQVPTDPVVQWLQTDLPVEQHPRTRPGGPLPQYELMIFDVASKQSRRVEPNPGPDWSIVPVRWAADGSELFFLRRDRESRSEELVAVRPDTGKTRVVVEERSATFVPLPLLDKPTLPLVLSCTGVDEERDASLSLRGAPGNALP